MTKLPITLRSESYFRNTLFNPSRLSIPEPHDDYVDLLRRLANNTPSGYYDCEARIFEHSARSESSLMDCTTLSGPLQFRLDRRRVVSFRGRQRRTISLRGWIESDRLKFDECRATGILFYEKLTHFNLFSGMPAARDLNLLFITGNGVPGTSTRRVLHRLQQQFSLPVYLIADNDTWGYFIYSVLKRGSVAPHVTYPELAVRNVKYLGMRAGDVGDEFGGETVLLPWKERWAGRIRAMSKYQCFRAGAWQQELKAFRKQRGKIEWDSFSYVLARKVSARILTRLRSGDWLG